MNQSSMEGWRLHLQSRIQKLTGNRMNLILICAITGIILIAGSYIWDEQTEPAGSSSQHGSPQTADAQVLERRLEEMVSRIDGAGQSCVMITMDSTREAIYARDLREAEDTSSTSEAGRSANSGNISREETHILMNRGSAEEPLVEKQIEPQVRKPGCGTENHRGSPNRTRDPAFPDLR